jgi:hypothetical protein
MQIPGRFTAVVSAVLFLICAAGSGYAQDAKASGMTPKSSRKTPTEITTARPLTAGTILKVVPDRPSPVPMTHGPISDVSTTSGTGGTLSGLVTVPTFSGAFAPQNGPSLGNIFPFLMMGNDPLAGGVTTIPAKMTEVSLTLLNADGTTFATVPFSSTFEDVMTDSPNFANSIYNSSSTATQFADAIQRAEFSATEKSSWHTRLGGPTIVNRVTWTIPKTVNVQFSDGTIEAVTAYHTGTASDGNTFVLLLNLLFNADYDNAVVNDINANNFTTNALNLDLLPNTFLFSANEASPNAPGSCCVLGFHTYFYAGGVTPQPRWVTLYSSYISPGLFGSGFQDVTAMSHEISESFNDPFLNNATPVWQFPGQPANSTVCQGNLETGDPVEVLSNATVAITLTEGKTTLTFHPQTEALLQWFEMGATSNAINGAFSYPNETALTASAVPCP